MGYNTEFKGLLKFNKLLIPEELEYLSSILGADTGDHPEWNEIKNTITSDTFYIDLRLSKCFTGVEWNSECEKTYNLPEAIKLVSALMNQKFNKQWNNIFGLHGELIAKGESFDDNWKIRCNGLIVKIEKLKLTGTKIECPHCKEFFLLKE